jgi:hypothetical protein
VGTPIAQRICNTALDNAQSVWVEAGNFVAAAPTEFTNEWLTMRSMLSFSGAKESDKQGSNFADLLTIRPLDRSGCRCYGFRHPLSQRAVGLRGLHSHFEGTHDAQTR